MSADARLREALDWCVNYIVQTRGRARPPEAEPFFSDRMARYRALNAVPPDPLDGLDVERKALEAIVNYAVGKGDEHGTLSYEEGWTIARAVVAELMSERVRHTSSIPKPGFSVRVEVVRAAADWPDRLSAPQFDADLSEMGG